VEETSNFFQLQQRVPAKAPTSPWKPEQLGQTMESKVIIVTGASRGIGLAVTKCLLAAAHKVVLIARSAEQLQELKEHYPSQVAYLAADMTVADVSYTENFRSESRP
jgi:NADP-dependent 3-hydroxy acid dehydrogenase YdfG